MGEASKRIDLIHELRQLRGSEELFDAGNHRPDVDKGLWRDGFDVLGGHPLANDTLHTAQADANLVLDQFADAADTTVGEMVLVVEAVTLVGVCEVQEICARSKHFGLAENMEFVTWNRHVDTEQVTDTLDLGSKLLVELVTADLGEVVALGVEERIFEVGAS